MDSTLTVFQNFQEHHIDWMHACGAKGRCTTCRMVVLSGMSQISDLSERERYYKMQGRLNEDERLACQCYVAGDIEIAVPQDTRLPHLRYTDVY